MTEAEYQEQLEAKNQSLRRAWTVLQVIRGMIEFSRGEELPAPERKSFDEEGKILCEALGKELGDLHEAVNRAAITATHAWAFRTDGPKFTTVQRDVINARELPRMSSGSATTLRWIGRHMSLEHSSRKAFDPKEANML